MNMTMLPVAWRMPLRTRVAFATVAGILDEVEAGVGGHPVLDDGGGVVGGAIVDYEDVGIPVAGFYAAEDAGEGGFDAKALVVGGDDDDEARRRQELGADPGERVPCEVLCERWADGMGGQMPDHDSEGALEY